MKIGDILLSKEISEYIEKNNLKDRVRAITIGVPSSVSKDKKNLFHAKYKRT